MNLVEARQFLGRTVSKTRYSAKKVRNLEFSIDTDYVMSLLVKQQGKCAITGWTLEFDRGGDFKGGKNPRGCTMDRIDNNKGYIPGNIQLACVLPNFLRGTMPLSEFVDLCKAVANNG